MDMKKVQIATPNSQNEENDDTAFNHVKKLNSCTAENAKRPILADLQNLGVQSAGEMKPETTEEAGEGAIAAIVGIVQPLPDAVGAGALVANAEQEGLHLPFIHPDDTRSYPRWMSMLPRATATYSREEVVVPNKAINCARIQALIADAQLAMPSNVVEDIDADDGNDLLLVSHYVNDIYDYLFRAEGKDAIGPNHLAKHIGLTANMRAFLIDWVGAIVDLFQFSSETFQLTVSILDRYLEAVEDVKRYQLMLMALGALVVASKYEEVFPTTLKAFVKVSGMGYTVKDIMQAESAVLKVIDYRLTRPLPVEFLRRFLKAAWAGIDLYMMAMFFVDVCLLDYTLVTRKPSELAAASVFLAVQLVNGDGNSLTGFLDNYWTVTLQFYTRYTAPQLHDIARRIATSVRCAPITEVNNVFERYQSQKVFEESLRPKFDSVLMDSIIYSSD